MPIKAKKLAAMLRCGSGVGTLQESEGFQEFKECLSEGQIRPEEFSLRDLAGELIRNRDGSPVGQGFIQEYFHPSQPGSLQEAMGAVDSSMFLGVTGQLMITSVLNAATQEEFIISRLIPSMTTPFNGERIPGITLPKDPEGGTADVKEGQPYPSVGFSEEYIETPMTTKHGYIIPITKEAIFFDRTGLVLERARYVGELLGLNKEKRLIGTVIGADNSYREKRIGDSAPVSLKTYYSAYDTGRWANHFDGNALTDWENVDYAEAKFADITDPNTGEPIILSGQRLILAPQAKAFRGQQLLTATQLWKMTQGDTNVYPKVNTVGPNMLQNIGVTLATSRQLRKQLVARLGLAAADADNYWFYGDPSKAFEYRENWPITVVQAPLNSEAEFSQDIVVRFKASERGVPVVREPRAFQRHRAISTSSSSGA